MTIAVSARVVTAALVLLGGCTTEVGPPSPKRPNVLLVTIDTLRADHVGSYGYSRPTTPRLDRLSEQGIRFADAVSVSSWTLPAHASLMTGLYPAEHGVETDVTALPNSAETLAERFRAEGYATFAAVSHIYLSRRWGFDQGFDVVDDSVARGSPHRPVAGHIADSVIEFLDGRSSSGEESPRPFFVWAHIFDPHWDYSPPPPMDTLFDPDYGGSMSGDYRSLAPYIRAVAKEDPPLLAERDLEHIIALYDGEIAYADTHIGRIFDTLQRTGDYEETVIVVTSDHGEEFMEHGSLEGHQWTLYDEVIMVPLIVRLPRGLGAGEIIEEQVSTVGLAGTILDIAGVSSELRTLSPLLVRRGVIAKRGTKAALPPALLDLTVARKHRMTGLRTLQGKLLRSWTGEETLYANPAPGNEHDDVSAKVPELRDRLSDQLNRALAGLHRLDDAGSERLTLDAAAREKLRALGYAQ